ncbi:MAG: 50S ribosomal protein L24 [Armatimonadetes bacterium]|nr:50S ribosomal protein L24 [Armatimonadota bacterium]
MHVKKGDLVEVIHGKHRGKRGKVLRVLTKHGRILVEGVNLVKRHTRPNQKLPQGGIVEKEAAVYGAKVMLVCPSCGKPTRLGHAIQDDGTRVRVCRRCGSALDKK